MKTTIAIEVDGKEAYISESSTTGVLMHISEDWPAIVDDLCEGLRGYLLLEHDENFGSEENDPVNHPSHYTNGSIECIDFIDSCGYGLDFCLANAIKYLTRCKLKGTCEQDIRKAIWYAEHAANGLKSGKYTLTEEEENKNVSTI